MSDKAVVPADEYFPGAAMQGVRGADRELKMIRIEELYLKNATPLTICTEVGMSVFDYRNALSEIKQKWLADSEADTIRTQLQRQMRQVERRAWQILHRGDPDQPTLMSNGEVMPGEPPDDRDAVGLLRVVVEAATWDGKFSGIVDDKSTASVGDQVNKLLKSLQDKEKSVIVMKEVEVKA
jgi:hypothetical protein